MRPASERRADGGSGSARLPVGPDSGPIVRAAGAAGWRRRKRRARSQSRNESGSPCDAAMFCGRDRSKSPVRAATGRSRAHGAQRERRPRPVRRRRRASKSARYSFQVPISRKASSPIEQRQRGGGGQPLAQRAQRVDGVRAAGPRRSRASRRGRRDCRRWRSRTIARRCGGRRDAPPSCAADRRRARRGPRSSPSCSRASSAQRRWATWMGSKVPPKTPRCRAAPMGQSSVVVVGRQR